MFDPGIFLYLLGALVGLAVIFAQLRLFSIDKNLREIKSLLEDMTEDDEDEDEEDEDEEEEEEEEPNSDNRNDLEKWEGD